MHNVPKKVVEIAQEVKEGQPSRRYRVRAVLKWFGAERRGSHIVSEIQKTLKGFGVCTEPALDKAGIEDQVRFVRLPSTTEVEPDPDVTDFQNPESPEIPDSAPLEAVDNHVADENSIGASALIAVSEDQLEPENGDEQPIVRPDDRPVTSQSSDWTISALRDKLDQGQLDLQPRFQREYVWSLRPELPSRLIESLLLEIPIPPIYFGKVADGRLEVIDGQQRLKTLVDFVSNKLPLRKLHQMSSLNDKYFKDLTKQQQEKILDTPIRSIVIDSGTNTELRYEIFERLNRGSMVLNEQELRNCVYRGPFNDLLATLEREPYWRKVKGGIEPEVRFKEREMILRFFAFANRLPQYTGNLKRFLNEYMGQFAPRQADELKAHTSLFKQTMQNIYAVFGEQSARLYDINLRTNRGS